MEEDKENRPVKAGDLRTCRYCNTLSVVFNGYVNYFPSDSKIVLGEHVCKFEHNHLISYYCVVCHCEYFDFCDSDRVDCCCCKQCPDSRAS